MFTFFGKRVSNWRDHFLFFFFLPNSFEQLVRGMWVGTAREKVGGSLVCPFVGQHGFDRANGTVHSLAHSHASERVRAEQQKNVSLLLESQLSRFFGYGTFFGIFKDKKNISS